MADNIIVAVRVRPFNQREKDLGCKCVVQMDSNSTYLDCGTEGRKTFNFDFSYWSHNADDHHFATQETVYNDIGKGVLANCWEGTCQREQTRVPVRAACRRPLRLCLSLVSGGAFALPM